MQPKVLTIAKTLAKLNIPVQIHTKYTGPDPYEMLSCAELLEKEIAPKKCWSEWSSGCYKPITSKEGQAEHDRLVKEIHKYINPKAPVSKIKI